MELLVSYSRGRYGKARREILRTLRRLGDADPAVERSSVEGIALVQSALEGREVVRRCRELYFEGFPFEFAVKWVPVDYWCEPDLEEIRRLLAEQVRDQIAQDETWGMKVEKRRWQRDRTRDIVLSLAKAIDRKVDLGHPDKLVRVDFVGERVAVSVLRPGDIFSIAAPEPPARETQPPQTQGATVSSLSSPAS